MSQHILYVSRELHKKLMTFDTCNSKNAYSADITFYQCLIHKTIKEYANRSYHNT